MPSSTASHSTVVVAKSRSESVSIPDAKLRCELVLAGEGEVLVEFSFHGVQSASVRSAVPRSAAVEPDEPPQEYEIASWSVKSPSFQSTHTLEIRCYLGTVFTIEFASAAIGLSDLKPGQRHEYPPAAPKP